MKILLASILVFASFSLSAKESYECDFLGPDYLLTFNDNGSIDLRNNFYSYKCEKGNVNFPGTYVELNVFNCSNKNEKKTFYYAIMSESEIILSKNMVLSRDISCTKI